MDPLGSFLIEPDGVLHVVGSSFFHVHTSSEILSLSNMWSAVS